MSASNVPLTVSEIAAAWVTGMHWKDVPKPVRDALRDGLLQSIPGGVAGLHTPEARIALDMARREAEPGSSTIYGDGLKVPAATAVLVNALMFCALEQQEMHVESGTHPYQTIVPAALVVAERQAVTGEEFMTAVLAGTEVMLAFAIIGLSITEGWGMETSHTSAVYGAVGTAATIARLLKLDARATANALGHAANLAAGLTEGLWVGTTEYHWALANGARVGHLAALLARSGAEAAPGIFEGRQGSSIASPSSLTSSSWQPASPAGSRQDSARSGRRQRTSTSAIRCISTTCLLSTPQGCCANAMASRLTASPPSASPSTAGASCATGAISVLITVARQHARHRLRRCDDAGARPLFA